MKRNKLPSFIINTLFYLGIVAIVLYFVAGFRYFNNQKTVLSEVKDGSLLVMRGPKNYDLKQNDIVLASPVKDAINIYKVNQINKEKVNIINSNGVYDIDTKDIKAIYLFSIPYLGNVIAFIITPMGMITIGILIGGYFLIKRFILKK